MATIKKETIGFNGVAIIREVKCDRKGIFSINLPKDLWEKLGINSHIQAKDLDTVLREWDSLVKQFDEAMTSRRKVIVYKLEVTARVYREERPHQPILDKDEINFTHGLAMDFAAGVFEEEHVKLKGRENKIYHRTDTSIPYGSGRLNHVEYHGRDYQIIDWSPEREEFFANVIGSFETLILRLHEFLGDEKPEKLLKLIDSGVPLLMAKAEREKSNVNK